MKHTLVSMLLFSCSITRSYSQSKLEFDGQLSAYVNYSPDSKLDGFMAARYLPKLAYSIKLDTTHILDFEASGNVYSSVSFHPFDSSSATSSFQAYRMWTRFSGKRYEVRIGLQKMDFGSATLMRPLQWFNQVDPRDPLKLTNGVYSALGRYYFLNNANIWLWLLYGNQKPRGFDAANTYQYNPEYGGRVQYPVPRGEVAISYHHRTADTRGIIGVPQIAEVHENRIGLDGKWDVKVGLWFELSYIHKALPVSILTNQTLFNVGTDYTFDIGSGLNVVIEHLVLADDATPFAFKNNTNISATMISYPVGLFDNISAVFNYNWNAENTSVFLNFNHQFKKVTGYVMAYYNPTSSATQEGIQQNSLVNAFAGPGIRLMAVFNH